LVFEKRERLQFNREDREGIKTKNQRPDLRFEIANLRVQTSRNAERDNLTFLSEVLRS